MRSNSQHDIYVTLGASNHTDVERSQNDFYATDPDAVRDLIKREKFDNCILEPCAGMGHISDTLRKEGFNVCAMDLYEYGNSNVVSGIDFLKTDCKFDCDIITNVPYDRAVSFVLKAIDSVTDGHKIAMFLKLQFLEGQKRYKDLFSKYPPSRIYVYTTRKYCSPDGKFYDENGKKISSAVAYAWYVWEKGFTGKPTIEWI